MSFSTKTSDPPFPIIYEHSRGGGFKNLGFEGFFVSFFFGIWLEGLFFALGAFLEFGFRGLFMVKGLFKNLCWGGGAFWFGCFFKNLSWEDSLFVWEASFQEFVFEGFFWLGGFFKNLVWVGYFLFMGLFRVFGYKFIFWVRGAFKNSGWGGVSRYFSWRSFLWSRGFFKNLGWGDNFLFVKKVKTFQFLTFFFSI